MGTLTKSLILKQSPIPATGARVSFGQGMQSRQSRESYLRYYSEVSWLRAAISTIAQAVAQSEWKLYKKNKGGDREEITGTHELKQILNRPNPFQSGHDLLELHQIFDELIGEVYWIKQKNRGSKELWIAPPQFMSAIPDPKEYISGWMFRRGDYEHKFDNSEVIPFIEPNPLDSMTGTGRAQSVGIDIESLSFLSQSNRNWFYWGSPAGTVISYPVEASITPDELDRLSEQWNAGHRSYGKAHKTAVLTQGATIQNATISSRDMDFSNLARYDRDAILGVFGVSFSVIGGTESVNRANAEAQLLNFARWVLQPRLIRIREKLNMFLVPDYGSDLELDFDSVIPEDETQIATNIDNHVKSGLMSIEEARQELTLGDIEPDHHFMVPFSMTIMTGEEMMSTEPEPPPPAVPPAPNESPDEEGPILPDEEAPEDVPPVPPEKSLKKNWNEAKKESFWKRYVRQSEKYEPKTIQALRDMYRGQEQEAKATLEYTVSQNQPLIDTEKAKQSYMDYMTPVLTDVIITALKNGYELLDPSNPHKQDIPQVANKRAIEWLLTRIAWAAAQTTEETAKLLAEQLAEGLGNGESMSQIATRVNQVFDNCSNVRALRIARTEVIAASSQGALEGYKEAGLSNVEFYTAIDERTCDYCLNYHEDVFPLGEEMPIPLHPNCRCVYLPVVR